MSTKTSPLVKSEMLGLFGNTLTTDHICSRNRWEILHQLFQTVLYQNRLHFHKFLLNFRNLHKILLILKKKISFIALIFWKLLTPTYVVTLMPVSSCFRTPFTSKCVHVSQRLLQRFLKHFNSKFPLIYDKLYWKLFTLVRSEMLGMFGNTFPANHKYSRHIW